MTHKRLLFLQPFCTRKGKSVRLLKTSAILLKTDDPFSSEQRKWKRIEPFCFMVRNQDRELIQTYDEFLPFNSALRSLTLNLFGSPRVTSKMLTNRSSAGSGLGKKMDLRLDIPICKVSLMVVLFLRLFAFSAATTFVEIRLQFRCNSNMIYYCFDRLWKSAFQFLPCCQTKARSNLAFIWSSLALYSGWCKSITSWTLSKATCNLRSR